MMALSVSYTGIGHGLQKGDLDLARRSFKAFESQFNGLSSGCGSCHATARTYYVDASVKQMITGLGKALDATPPDGKNVEKLMGYIGNEACLQCHFVHMPAANAKARWKAFAELFGN
jgi:hypothetical protein